MGEKFEMVLVSNSRDIFVNVCGVHHPQLKIYRA
jgi:hypothetical protein